MKEEFKRFSANGLTYVDDGVRTLEEVDGKITERVGDDGINWAYINAGEVSSVDPGPILKDKYYSCYVKMKNGDVHHIVDHASEVIESIRNTIKEYRDDPSEGLFLALDSVTRPLDVSSYMQGKIPTLKHFPI